MSAKCPRCHVRPKSADAFARMIAALDADTVVRICREELGWAKPGSRWPSPCGECADDLIAEASR